MHPLVKLAVDAGPLVAFFVANGRWGLFVATAVFMVAIVIALGVSWALERRLAPVPLVSAAFVLVFGGLTLYLGDEQFIKMKPTVVNVLFATILMGGLVSGRLLVKPLFGRLIAMDDAGWRRLTLRWVWFFVGLAVLNELVWRNVSTDTWVAFKVFGLFPLTLAFGLAQIPLMQRHRVEEDAA